MSHLIRLKVILPKSILLKYLYYQMKSLKRGWLDKAPVLFESKDGGKSGITKTYNCEKGEKLVCVITLIGFEQFRVDYSLTVIKSNQEESYTLPHTIGRQNSNINNQQNLNLQRDHVASFTAFIGGAADKYQFLWRLFWLNPPDDIGAGPTYIMRGVMRDFKNRINSNIHSINYYGYEEAYGDHTVGMTYRKPLLNLMTDIKNVLKKNPKTQINLVGHSLGGWNAAGLAEELHNNGICKVNCLITIDPVGENLSKTVGAKIYLFEPKPDVKKWINITSVQYNKIDDWIATIGNRWDNISKATLSAETNYHHGQANAMFKQKLFERNTKSAFDILLEELKNVQI